MNDITMVIYVDIFLALIIVSFLINSLIEENICKEKKISEIFKKYESEAEND